VAVVIALLALVPKISANAGTPNLPTLSAAELIARVQKTNVQALSGTIQLKSNLGIPNLSSLTAGAGRGGSFDPTIFLAGTHSADIAASKDGFKVSYPSTLSEQDLITNGHDLWTWQSQGQKVTHVVLPAKAAEPADGTAKANEQASGVKTPDQVAQQLLSKLDPTTTVSVANQAYVAGQPAYQLILTPKATDTTVDHVTIAVDGKQFVPLDIQVVAKGASGSPALDFGFTKVSYKTPSAKTFTFTPPPDAKVTTKQSTAAPDKSAPDAKDASAPDTLVTGPSNGATKPVTVGQGWDTIAVFNAGRLPAQVGTVLEKGGKSVPGGTMTSTPLFNVLLMKDGRVAVGAVQTQSPLWAQIPTP
jgi:outer membrane lipoprotein-sorting protein